MIIMFPPGLRIEVPSLVVVIFVVVSLQMLFDDQHQSQLMAPRNPPNVLNMTSL